MQAVPDILSIGAALLASVIVGGLKAPIAKLDTKVRNFIKPAQPMIALGLTFALPVIGNALGVVDMGPVEAWANAPAATLLAITGREALSRFRRRV